MIEPIKVEFTGDFDADVLACLYGQTQWPERFSLEIRRPIKRTFWQWLRRRHQQENVILIPNAVLKIEDPA